MKKTFLISFFAAIAIIVSAQSDLGVDYFSLGEYDAAKRYFEKNLTQSPALSNFYLGEIAYIQGKESEAKTYYDNGLAADPNDLYNQIGQAQLLLKSDLKTAESLFAAIQKKSKKDPLVILAIGRAYFDAGMKDKARLKLEEARKRNKKLPQIYIFEGDLIKAESGNDKLGDIAGKYEMAIYFDPSYRLGYIKAAQAYALFNPTTAIEKLKEIIALQPDYLLAHRQLGQVSTQIGMYNQAIVSYTKYMDAGEYSLEDLKNYVRVLYFSDMIDDAQKAANEGLALEPNDFVLNRLQMYIYSKTKNTEKGLAQAAKFFSLREDKSSHLALDYTMYASLLTEGGRYNEALAAYNDAILIDNKPEYYLDAVEVGRAKGDFGISADYYIKYMNAIGSDAVETKDYNTLGFYYYNAGTVMVKKADLLQEMQSDAALVKTLAAKGNVLDSLQNSADYFSKALSVYYLTKADSVFQILVERIPESYSGYRWRALAQHAIALVYKAEKDGAAKPYYEKVIEVITTSEEENSAAQNKVLVEAYNYLAYYYLLNDELDLAKVNCDEVVKIEANNRTTVQLLDAIKQRQDQIKEHKRQQAAAAAAAAANK